MDTEDKQLFFTKAQDHLLMAKTWSDFLSACCEIKHRSIRFELPSLMYSSSQHATEDKTSGRLMPSDANPCLVPMKSFGDGNCFYRSLSLVLFGNEDGHIELRV